MTFAVTLTEIAIFIIAIAFFLLVIYTIPAVLQIRQTAKALEELTSHGKETVDNVNTLIKKASDHSGEFTDIIKKFREVSLKALGLTELVVGELRRPIITLVSLFVGLEYGLKHLKKKKGKEGK